MNTTWIFDLSYITHLFHYVPGTVSVLDQWQALIRRIRDQHAPTKILAAMDAYPPSFRHKLHQAYKAKRPPKTLELLRDLCDARHLMKFERIPTLCLDGYEADDLMATVARQEREKNQRCVLVTADKDLRQCLRKGVVGMYCNKPSGWEFFGESEAENDWGVPRSEFVGFQALVGDSVDGITGAGGIGKKTAAKLIQDRGSFVALMDNIDKVVSNKHRASLREFLGRMEVVLKLITMVDDLDLLPLEKVD